jgi:formate hydrogenlyase transcriptional activator
MIGGAGGAADKLGLKRTTLNSKIRKLSIERSDYA